MHGPYLIGVDLGTSAVKATLVDAAGVVLANASRDMPLRRPMPGQAEQDADEYLSAALETIRGVAAETALVPGEVAAITLDGQMAGAMGVGRDGRALTPWYPSALDTRYQPCLRQMVQRVGDRLLELGGALPYAGPRMLWWKEHFPDLYHRIDKFVTLAGYVVGRLGGLTGEEAFIDPSYLTWFGLCDTRLKTWSSELAEPFDLSLAKLPRIVDAVTVVGRLTAAAAGACGLMEGIPLAAGTGDQVAGFLGAGVVEPGQLIDVAGTFPVFATCVERFFVDNRCRVLVPLAAPAALGRWYSMMYISGGGLSHRWAADLLAGRESPEGADVAAHYRALDDEARGLPPGAGGLLFVPHLVGRACPEDREIRGAWLGLTLDHGRPHLYRAVLESMAYEYAGAMRVVRHYCPEAAPTEVRVAGGGAGSDLWNQIKADVLGVAYVRLRQRDIAAVGCALIGGCAVGLFDDMAAAARRLAATSATFQPRRDAVDDYRHYVEAYYEALTQLSGVSRTLAALRQRASTSP